MTGEGWLSTQQLWGVFRRNHLENVFFYESLPISFRQASTLLQWQEGSPPIFLDLIGLVSLL